MTATTTDVREWAKARGIDIGAHGRIPAHVREQYEAEQTADGDGALYPVGPPGVADDDFGVTAADFPPEPPPELERQAETRPRRIRPAKTGGGVLARFRKPKASAKTARPAKRLPRVSLAGLIEDAWSQMAWAAAPLPPMQRLLYAQAPFAGVALEGALAGTIVDKALQPVARAEEKAKAVGGLVMPPVALLAVLATAPQPSEVRNEDGTAALAWPEPSFAHKTALVNLRWSLMLMAEVGQIHLEEYKAKAEAAAARGAMADEFMAWILGMELPPEVPVREEEEAVKRAQAMFGDQP
jgi:hypothetical protein